MLFYYSVLLMMVFMKTKAFKSVTKLFAGYFVSQQ